MSIQIKKNIKAISIIIPVYKEKNINELTDHLREISNSRPVEIIVVDGEKSGGTIKKIKSKNIITLVSEKGRAIQMNAGAKKASGKILLFLHADTLLPNNAIEKIIETINRGFTAGAFDLTFDSSRLPLRFIAKVGSIRSKITCIPFGDQAIFLRRDSFNDLGGYKEIPLMEDVDIMRRIKKRGGQIRILPDKIITSARNWERDGILYTNFRNWALQFLYFIGVSPERLERIYYKKK